MTCAGHATDREALPHCLADSFDSHAQDHRSAVACFGLFFLPHQVLCKSPTCLFLIDKMGFDNYLMK